MSKYESEDKSPIESPLKRQKTGSFCLSQMSTVHMDYSQTPADLNLTAQLSSARRYNLRRNPSVKALNRDFIYDKVLPSPSPFLSSNRKTNKR
jgi:hypothetical protein